MNGAQSLIREQVEFDDAIAAVLVWAKDRDDTLIVLTCDHGEQHPQYGASRGAAPAARRSPTSCRPSTVRRRA